MGMNLEFLKIVINYCPSDKKTQLLSLGYPDLLLTSGCLKSLDIPVENLNFRQDSKKIAAWHSFETDIGIPDANEFFSLLGFDLTVLDFKQTRGGELVTDLNYLISEESIFKRFDFVIDSGTLEHLFFPTNGFLNVFRLLETDGVYIHTAPINRLNHGFWSFNPVFYADFAAINDVQILDAFVFQTINNQFKKFKVPWHSRVNQTPAGCAICVIFRKGAHYKEQIPIQGKYL